MYTGGQSELMAGVERLANELYGSRSGGGNLGTRMRTSKIPSTMRQSSVYAPWVNADRLTAVAAQAKSARVRAFWSALAAWQGKDRRFDHWRKYTTVPGLTFNRQEQSSR